MTPPDPLGALVVPAPPGLPGAATQSGAVGDPTAAEEFEALVSRLLAGAGEVPTTLPAPGAVLAEAAKSLLPGTATATGADADAVGGDEGDVAEGTDPSATVAGVLPDAAAWLLPPPEVRAALASAPPATGSLPAPTEPVATERTGATQSVPAPTGPGTTTTPDATTSTDVARPAVAPPVALPDAGAASATTQPTAMTAMTPVTGAATTAAAGTTTAPNAVTRQVFPEVVRLAASGEGTATQRVTLLLKPESLGEVRVVLTTRHGELQVSLSAAGGDTHRALLEGTPELRRLLETIGSPDARVVVRDLPGPAPPPSPPPPGRTPPRTSPAVREPAPVTPVTDPTRARAAGRAPPPRTAPTTRRPRRVVPSRSREPAPRAST